MRVAFVVGAFPEISSTFILDQVTGLLDLGHDVHVFARKPPPGPVHADVARYRLAERTHYWAASREAALQFLPRALRTVRQRPMRRAGVLARSLDPFRHGPNALLGRSLLQTITMLSEGPFDVVLAQFGVNGRVALKLRETGAFDAPIATTWLGYDLSQILRTKGPHFYEDLLARGDLMLPLSRHFRDRLRTLGCADDKLRVHPVGIHLDAFPFAPRAPCPGEPTRIVTVCRLVEKKGIEFALRALAQVRGRGIPFVYDIVGDGPLRSRIEQLRADLGLTEQVVMHGTKTRDQVAEILGRSHVFLSPSVTARNGDEEGVPAAIKEAMAAGLPVVSTTHAAIPELITDGVSGLLVPEWDVHQLSAKLAHLLTSPEIWSPMTRAAREVVERTCDVTQLNATLAHVLADLAARYQAASER